MIKARHTDQVTQYTLANEQLVTSYHFTDYDTRTGHGTPAGASFLCHGCGTQRSGTSQLEIENAAYAHSSCNRISPA